jgi:hypothetical protein
MIHTFIVRKKTGIILVVLVGFLVVVIAVGPGIKGLLSPHNSFPAMYQVISKEGLPPYIPQSGSADEPWSPTEVPSLAESSSGSSSSSSLEDIERDIRNYYPG